MKKDIYEFTDYKRYLQYWLDHQPQKGRGLRLALAKKMQVQTGYVSQVLVGEAHFSLEQAESVNEFIDHNFEEGNFFLLILQYSRAGTANLKKRFKIEIDKKVSARSNLKERFEEKKTLELVDQMRYYSSWYYAAVHIAVAIPELRAKDALMKHLHLDFETMTECLDFLESVGLIKKVADQYEAGVARLFLGSDSPMIKKHHANWRQHAMNSLDRGIKQDLHFSTVFSIAKSDFVSIREQLIKAIEEARAQVRSAKASETLCSFNVDFVRLF